MNEESGPARSRCFRALTLLISEDAEPRGATDSLRSPLTVGRSTSHSGMSTGTVKPRETGSLEACSRSEK